MDPIAAVMARVQELQSRLERPEAGFSQALQAQVQSGQAAAQAQPTTAAAPAAPGAPPASVPVTLGGLLGLPAVPVSGAAATGAAAPAAQVGAAGAGGEVGPGGLLVPVDGRYTSGFGMRRHPISGTHKLHAGIDLAAPTGTPIRAAQGGTVSYAGQRGGYGNLVIVDHPDGTQTRYAHASRLDVRAGDVIERGAVVGAVGSTGASTGPHLHFEVRRDGEPVDPAPLLGLEHDH